MTEPAGYTPQPLGERARRLAREQGAVTVARRLGRWGVEALFGLPWTVAGSRGEFELGGRRYPYLFDRYKRTWLTERAVEVPVIGALVDRHGDGRVLEVGHVLGHYRDGHHIVVDKYERAPGVLNRDALELADLGRFDLIVAISTLEHVGWDELPHDPSKATRAVQALRAMLAPGGRLELTVPAGYNPSFDAALRECDSSTPARCGGREPAPVGARSRPTRHGQLRMTSCSTGLGGCCSSRSGVTTACGARRLATRRSTARRRSRAARSRRPPPSGRRSACCE